MNKKMFLNKFRATKACCAGLAIASFALPLMAALNTASVVNSTLGAPAGGGGDSLSPVVSADGRYVLFASSANNLAFASNNAPIVQVFPPKLNVYLRDRTNGTTTLISINSSGTGGGSGDSFPVDISTNGQYVLFESSASNLVANASPTTNVYLRDLAHNTTTLVSVNTNGAGSQGSSWNSVMTPDARYIAFVGAGGDLVAGDTNHIADVFVRDMQLGVTTLVSQGASWGNIAFPYVSGVGSDLPDITPDGRYIAFYSTATNLVPGVTNSGEVYVRDTIAGTTIWASQYAHTAVQQVYGNSNSLALNHRISDDGQFVAYEAVYNSTIYSTNAILIRFNTTSSTVDVVATNASALWGGTDLNHRYFDMTPDGRFLAYAANLPGGTGAVYRWDGLTYTTNMVVGTNASATVSACDWPVMDTTGRYVAYWADAVGVVTNSGASGYHLYETDMQSGTTRLVDANTNGIASGGVYTAPRMSADGSVIAFDALDSTLVPNDSNQAYDVFAVNPPARTVELISAAEPDAPSLTPNGLSTASLYSVSANARYIAFSSEATNLVPGDTNGVRDVFMRDLLGASNILVSVTTNGGVGSNAPCIDSSISGDGRYVAFTSSSSHLVAGDSNGLMDVFVRDLQLGVTTLVSVTSNNAGPGNGASYSPIISTNGRYVLFRSTAENLAGTITSTNYENVYWRDLQAGVTSVFITNSSATAPAAAMTSDGRYVASVAPSSSLYIWDTFSKTRIYTNGTTSFTTSTMSVGISPDGTRVGFMAGSPTLQIYAADRIAKTSVSLGTAPSPMHVGLRFSADSRYLAYVANTNSINQVYLYDFQTSSNLIISQSTNGVAGSAASDSPDISPDGRFIAYRSVATNLATGLGFSNSAPLLYLYDRVMNTTTMIGGGTSPAWRSSSPVFSGDSQTLVFSSWDPNLVQQDGNQYSDVFTLDLYATNSQPPFNITLASPVSPGQAPVITWTPASGKNYQVQFKNYLSEPAWQVLNGTVTVNGSQNSMTDPNPATGQRFYRIVSY